MMVSLEVAGTYKVKNAAANMRIILSNKNPANFCGVLLFKLVFLLLVFCRFWV